MWSDGYCRMMEICRVGLRLKQVELDGELELCGDCLPSSRKLSAYVTIHRPVHGGARPDNKESRSPKRQRTLSMLLSRPSNWDMLGFLLDRPLNAPLGLNRPA